MSTKNDLIQLLVDTRRWAANPDNADTGKLYSDWSSHEVLLSKLDQHLIDAQNGRADLSKLAVLFAPTAGLCEIVSSDAAANAYLSLAARFDTWYATARSE